MLSVTQLRGFAKRLSTAEVAMWVLDEDSTVLFASDAAGAAVGCRVDDLIGQLAVPSVSPPKDAVSGSGRLPEHDPAIRSALARLASPPGLRDAGMILQTWGEADRGNDRQVMHMMLARDEHPIVLGVIAQRRLPSLGGNPQDESLFDALELRRTLDSWRNDNRRFHDAAVAGNSSAARRLRKQVEVAAQLREDALIIAPEGFPADRIARQLHASIDVDEPLEVIDGSLMDLELLEAVGAPLISHLTGSEASSTTATAVVVALDQTPGDAQSRLAQWKEVFGRRLRLIGLATDHAVTNDSNEALMESLSGLVIRVPSLSERGDDVSLIATAMLEARRHHDQDLPDRINRDGLDALVRYPWPGDVGELEDSIRHAAGVCTGTAITKENLPLAVRSYRPGVTAKSTTPVLDLDAILAAIERRFIDDALRLADGNRAEAARRLGISRARLLRRLDDTSEETDTA